MEVEAGFRNEPGLVHAPAVLFQARPFQMDRHLTGRIPVHVEVPRPVAQIESIDERFARAGVPGIRMVGAADLHVGADLTVGPFGEKLSGLVVGRQEVSLQILRQVQAHHTADARGLVDVERLDLPPFQRKPA